MKHSNLKRIEVLLSPSWLSGLIVGFIWVVVVVAGLVSTHFSGSLWQKGLFHLGERSGETYQQLTSQVSDNRLIDNLPLFVFWLGMGIVVYYLAAAIYEALHQVAEIHEELHYVHVRRQELIRAAIEQFAVRFVAVTIAFIYIAAFFKKLVPYALAGLRHASLDPLHAVWVALLLLVGMHVITVLVRLMFLRERLFSSAVYDL
jgi:hypothetical protein